MKLKDFDFRIYHKEIGYFKEPAYVLYQREVEQRLPKEIQCKSIDDSEIELFTGVKDCKRKKIYEGDIIQHSRKVQNGKVKKIEYHSKVVWNSKKAIFELHLFEYPDILTFDEMRCYDMCIVGNIHDKNFVKNLKKSELQGETK